MNSNKPIEEDMEEKPEKKMESQTKATDTKKSPANSQSLKDTQKLPYTKSQYMDRASLKPEALSRIDQWVSQIQKRYGAVRVTRNEVVNFVLLQHAPSLSEEELSSLGHAHYDDLRFYTWAIKIVREARSRGEALTVEDLKKKHNIPNT